MDQPTTLRLYESMITARYSQPSHVRTYVMSANHFSSGAVAINCRWTRSWICACSVRVSRPSKPPRRPTDQAGLAHEPSNTLAGDALLTLAQLGVDTRCAIGATAAVVNGPNLLRQCQVGLDTTGWLTMLPSVVTAWGDLQHPTELSDRMLGLLRRDEPIAAHRVVSLAKKAAAFRQDLSFFTQNPVLTPQPRKFLTFDRGQSISPTCIDVSLRQPPPHDGLGEVQIAAHLTDGFAASAQQVNRLRLEFLCKRASPTRGHHGHSPRAQPDSSGMSTKLG